MIAFMLIQLIGNLLPFFVVAGHFVPTLIALVLFAVYYGLSAFFPAISNIIGIVLAIVGAVFAFTDFPLWFFALYIVIVGAYYYIGFKVFKQKKE